MDEAFRQRAEARRASWTGGVAHSFEELEARGLEFWQQASPGVHLAAICELIYDAWVIGGRAGSPPRLQRSVVGVARFER